MKYEDPSTIPIPDCTGRLADACKWASKAPQMSRLAVSDAPSPVVGSWPRNAKLKLLCGVFLAYCDPILT